MVLKQGSYFQDCQYLGEKKECDLVQKLVMGDVDGVHCQDVTSMNGKMLQYLVTHINENWPLRIPKGYQTFIADLCEMPGVVGLLFCEIFSFKQQQFFSIQIEVK